MPLEQTKQRAPLVAFAVSAVVGGISAAAGPGSWVGWVCISLVVGGGTVVGLLRKQQHLPTHLRVLVGALVAIYVLYGYGANIGGPRLLLDTLGMVGKIVTVGLYASFVRYRGGLITGKLERFDVFVGGIAVAVTSWLFIAEPALSSTGTVDNPLRGMPDIYTYIPLTPLIAVLAVGLVFTRQRLNTGVVALAASGMTFLAADLIAAGMVGGSLSTSFGSAHTLLATVGAGGISAAVWQTWNPDPCSEPLRNSIELSGRGEALLSVFLLAVPVIGVVATSGRTIEDTWVTIRVVVVIVVVAATAARWIRSVNNQQQQARHDTLTGLRNRQTLYEHVAGRQRQGGGVYLFDIDGFRDLNASVGYEAGDRVLVAVARRLTAVADQLDVVVGRHGPGTLAVFDPHARDITSATLRSRKLHQVFDAAIPIDDSATVNVTAAAGVSFINSPDGSTTDATELFRTADIATTFAKRQGPGRHSVYDPKMLAASRRRRALLDQMAGQVEPDRFRNLYFPVVNLHTGTISSVDARLRWRLNDGSVVAGQELTEVAQQTHLLKAVGALKLFDACGAFKHWVDNDIVDTVCTLTYHALGGMFDDNSFADIVTETLSRSALAAEKLTIDVDVNVVRDVEGISEQLHHITELGVNISVSKVSYLTSLSDLQRHPYRTAELSPDISATFSNRKMTDSELTELVAAIKASGITVGVGGIENYQTLAVAHALGCDTARGPVFGCGRDAFSITELIEDTGRVGVPGRNRNLT